MEIKETDVKKRFTVILVNPKHAENIGLVARSMKNTGFEHLSIVGLKAFREKTMATAVHAINILDNARFYPDVSKACADFNLIFGATAKPRKNFSIVSLKQAVDIMFDYPPSTKIGLLFGTERTGLTSEEMRYSNFRFTIPQALKQPSYNLASAVLLTLFQIYSCSIHPESREKREEPLSWEEQDKCIRLILEKLEDKKFIHTKNKKHMTQTVYDLFGRLSMTSRDRNLLLAIFSKGPDNLF